VSTQDHSPTGDAEVPEKPTISEQAFMEMQESERFDQLRQRFRRFSFPMSAAFLLWYLSYVLLSTYAVDFMSTPVLGNLNLGLILGLLQFVTTFAITWLYIRHANRNLDPIAKELRASLEEGTR